MSTQLELNGEDFDLSHHFDLDKEGIVVRVSANEVKVVRIIHHFEYQGPGKPPLSWDTEHLLLNIAGEGVEVLEVLE